MSPVDARKDVYTWVLCIAAELAVLTALLFHWELRPNSDEYKIVIVAIFAFLVFFTSSYYPFRITDKKRKRKRDAFLGVFRAILAATLTSSLFHLVLCPNSEEYKIVIAAIFAFIVFITSSYYTIQTTDKQNMYNAYLQARMSIWNANAARWFRNGNKWGMHYTKDRFCLVLMFGSCLAIFATLISSILLKTLFWCWLLFIIGVTFLGIVLLIRLGLIDFRCFFSIYDLTKNFKKFNDFKRLKQWFLGKSGLTLWMEERDRLGKDVRYRGWFKDNYDKREFFADPEPKPAQLFPIWISKETKERLDKCTQKRGFFKGESDDDTIKRLLKECEEEK